MRTSTFGWGKMRTRPFSSGKDMRSRSVRPPASRLSAGYGWTHSPRLAKGDPKTRRNRPRPLPKSTQIISDVDAQGLALVLRLLFLAPKQ